MVYRAVANHATAAAPATIAVPNQARGLAGGSGTGKGSSKPAGAAVADLGRVAINAAKGINQPNASHSNTAAGQ